MNSDLARLMARPATDLTDDDLAPAQFAKSGRGPRYTLPSYVLGRPAASSLPEYSPWTKMIARCTSPQHVSFVRYGGRGITVAPSWLGIDGFARFVDHIGPRPGSDYSIDRINNDGNYEPGNVRWATPLMQARNTRNLHLVSIDGETLCCTEWAERLGVTLATVRRWLALEGSEGIRQRLAKERPVTSRLGERTHCPKGHPYDEVNTYRRPDRPGRMCLQCGRDRRAISTARRVGASPTSVA